MTAIDLYNRIDTMLYDEFEEAEDRVSETFDQYERALDEGKGDTELSAYLRFFVRARERLATIQGIINSIRELGAEIDE